MVTSLSIHFRDQQLATATLDKGTVVVNGDDSVKQVVDYYRKFAEGQALLDLLVKRMRGQWWVEELDNHPSPEVVHNG
jgi:hypothetical protein